MRLPLTVTAALSVTLAASFSGTAQARPDSPPGETSGWIVVLTDASTSIRVADDHRQRYGAGVSNVYRHALRGYSAHMSASAAAHVAADPRVAFVQPDSVLHTTAPGGKPGKPGGGSGGGEDGGTTGQTLPTGINRVNADASPAAAINGVDERVDVDVAVIDTGVDLDHPDLNVYTAGAQNCSTGKSADDGHGHGTHVAGTIGAKDDTTGVVGVAAGARIWPVRVLDNRGSGSLSAVICGIDYVTANADEIEVANMSLGGAGTDGGNCGNNTKDALHRAICRSVAAGVTYVVAAGNERADAATSTPAAYDEVITVSTLADFNGLPGGGAASTCRSDVDDTFANFSNYGADVDLIAPGVCISSTWKGGGYNTISGSSMASPHVAGGAALYLAANPGATPTQVKAALQSAGSLDWNDLDDPDNTKEKLLDVTVF